MHDAAHGSMRDRIRALVALREDIAGVAEKDTSIPKMLPWKPRSARTASVMRAERCAWWRAIVGHPVSAARHRIL